MHGSDMHEQGSSSRREIRCAIYTRKSTEDGLEQEFNSLDAQHEACAAYILSQRHEGWEQLPDRYDDGGFSGGSMQRPGLVKLMADVEAGGVDVIVVYKVDRLTRSLADFAKIVEILDDRQASFVSVTQAFNTTSSMGRLTLNVLLSFAQFEREVTGERIRDKIAASKKKGMWMGGNVPLGYDVVDRKLVVVAEDADTLQSIFVRYLQLGNIRALHDDLILKDIRTKVRTSRAGKTHGGGHFSYGALAALLKNRTCIGKTHHKGRFYDGKHDAIISDELFNSVQKQLELNTIHHRNGSNVSDPSLLVGLIYDVHGRKMAPSHATKQSRRYRYYVSQETKTGNPPSKWRVPAGELEPLIASELAACISAPEFIGELMDRSIISPDAIRQVHRQVDIWSATLRSGKPTEQRAILRHVIARIDMSDTQIALHIDGSRLADTGSETSNQKDAVEQDQYRELVTHIIHAKLARVGAQVRLAIPASKRCGDARQDMAMIKLVVKAHEAKLAVETAEGRAMDDIVADIGVAKDYFRALLKVAYLAPDITTAILEGRQPAQLNRQLLARMSGLPLDWGRQREMLGFVDAEELAA